MVVPAAPAERLGTGADGARSTSLRNEPRPSSPVAGSGFLVQRGPLLLALLVLLAIGAWRISVDGVSVDEAYSLDTARRPFVDTVRQALWFELQPPVYFVTLHAWLRGHDSLAFARVLSLLSVAGTLLTVDAISRRLGASTRGTASLLVGLSPTVLWAAVTARSYGLTLLLISLATLHFVNAWIVDSPRPRRASLLWAVCSSAAIYNFYYSGFIVAAHVIAAFVGGRHRSVLVRATALVGLTVVPWLPVVADQMTRHDRTNPELTFGAGVAGALAAAGWFGGLWKTVLLGRAPIFARPGVLAVVVLGIVLLFVARWRSPRSPWGRAEWAMAATGLIPFVTLAALAAFDIAHVEHRYYVITIPGILVFLALLVDRIRGTRLRSMAAAAVVTVSALTALSYERNYSREGWKSLATALRSARTPAEPIFFFTPEGEVAFRHHDPGAERLYGLPRDRDRDTWDQDEFVLGSAAQLEERIGALVPGGATFWLVTYQAQPRFGAAVLDEWLRARADTIMRLDHPAVHAVRYRLRPHATP
jgi:hypothetical protein